MMASRLWWRPSIRLFPSRGFIDLGISGVDSLPPRNPLSVQGESRLRKRKARPPIFLQKSDIVFKCLPGPDSQTLGMLKTCQFDTFFRTLMQQMASGVLLSALLAMISYFDRCLERAVD